MLGDCTLVIISIQSFSHRNLASVDQPLNLINVERVRVCRSIGAAEVPGMSGIRDQPRCPQLVQNTPYLPFFVVGHLRKPELAWIDSLTPLEGHQLSQYSNLARAPPYVSQIMEP